MKKPLAFLLIVAIFATMSTTVFAQDLSPNEQPDKTVEIKIINPSNFPLEKLSDFFAAMVEILNTESAGKTTIVISSGTQEQMDIVDESIPLEESKSDDNDDATTFGIACPGEVGHVFHTSQLRLHNMTSSGCLLYVYTYNECTLCGYKNQYGPHNKGTHTPGSVAESCPN